MPGRHSGGSLGGGFSGGGFRGGGMPGGGWGGGWRPRGPWYGGYRRPFFGGWGWGWLPWMWFGPRFGFGGGGCGCLVIAFIIFIFICVSSGFSLGNGEYYNPGYTNFGGYNLGSSNNGGNNNNNGAPSLSNESPAVQTQTARDLTELHAAFDSRIPQWQSSLTSNENRSIPPADAGLNQDNNTKDVLYGKCGTAFYLYVVDVTRPDTGPADGEGYVYTTASSPGACHPPQYTVYQSEDVGGNWYFTLLQSTGR